MSQIFSQPNQSDEPSGQAKLVPSGRDRLLSMLLLRESLGAALSLLGRVAPDEGAHAEREPAGLRRPSGPAPRVLQLPDDALPEERQAQVRRRLSPLLTGLVHEMATSRGRLARAKLHAVLHGKYRHDGRACVPE